MKNKIPIRIHPLFWLFAGLIGFLNSENPMQIAIWICVILVSILVHEFGHALMGKLFSQKVWIELFAFGGITYREGKRLPFGKEFLVVLAGPFFGFMLFLISYFFLHQVSEKNSYLFFALNLLSIVNLLWTILNLIPVLPLDGGHLLNIILEKLFGFRGIKAAHFISFILGGILTLVFFVMGQLFLGILFSMLAFTSYRSYKQVKQMSGQDQDNELKEIFEKSEKELLAGHKEEAKRGFEQVRTMTTNGMIYSIATETLALLLAEEGKSDEAYSLLKSLKKVSPELIPKFHELSFKAKDYQRCLKIGEEAYQLLPTSETAIINAKVYAHLNQAEPAVGWLECALTEGLVNVDALIKSEDFDSIRQSEEFQDFQKELL